MKQNVEVIVRGRQSEWGVDCYMRQDQIDGMREDGIQVEVVAYTIPMWVVNCGLATPWCFVQDVINFRNPLR